jgi:hypothetical protein
VADAFPELNLITNLVAIDGDAKRSPGATPFNIPESICRYIRPLKSYSEFSTSLRGLRALVFGTLPTEKQNITKSFNDATELSLYRGGWVTLSGLPCADSLPTIEHRQDALDQILEELWPNLNVVTAGATNKTASDVPAQARLGECFVLDWSRTASEGSIRQFIQGWNRTPKQLADITATWDLQRGWDHGATPDHSLYTKRILEEALWLQRFFGWTLQDVVDIVVTFCKKHQLRWSFGRAKKQIADGQRYILSCSSQRRAVLTTADVHTFALHKKEAPTLTCNVPQITSEENRNVEPMLTGLPVNNLPIKEQAKSRDTLGGILTVDEQAKLSRSFRHESIKRDAVLQAINNYRGWVKVTTIAARIGRSVDAAKKQLQRLGRAGLVDGDGKGRYRRHLDHKLRELKPCSSKPIPMCKGINAERKTLSRCELLKRGWPPALIDKTFPVARLDYIEKEIAFGDQLERIVKARFYWVWRIKTVELQPSFEVERAKILRQSCAKGVEHRGT